MPVEVVKPSAFDNPHGRRLSVYLNGELINVSALGEVTSLDQSYLSKVLRGKVHPSGKNLRIIASALNMTVDDLLFAIELRNLK